jgi:hypothetical protein
MQAAHHNLYALGAHDQPPEAAPALSVIQTPEPPFALWKRQGVYGYIKAHGVQDVRILTRTTNSPPPLSQMTSGLSRWETRDVT